MREIIIQREKLIYKTNKLYNVLIIEAKADREMGLLPILENNVKEVSWNLEQSFSLCGVLVDSS